VPGETIRAGGTPYFRPSGRVDLEMLNVQQDYWIREGLMRDRADLSRVVDQSFADYANQLLGSQ
jgi:hypothetical protein